MSKAPREDFLEHKRTDEELRASEIRYRRLFETAQDGILILDAASGAIVDINPFLVNLLGYPRSYFIGKTLWDIGPFKQIPESKAAFKELQVKQYIRYENLALETSSGRRVNVEFVSNVYGANGSTVIQCNVRDITERKQAEERIAAQAAELGSRAEEVSRWQKAWEEKSDMLQSVLNSTSEGLVAADLQGNFIMWNPAAERLLGRGPANIPIQEWSRHYGLYLTDKTTPFPWDLVPLAQAIRGDANTAEIFVRWPEPGAGVFLEAYASPLKDENGQLKGGVVAFRNITERKEAEETLRMSELRLNQAQHHAHLGSWHYLPGGTLIWSREMYELYKVPPDVIPTSEWLLSAVHPEERSGFDRFFKQFLDSAASEFQRDFRIVWPDGQIRYMSSIAKVHRDQGGRVLEVVGTTQDVTERIQREERLREYQRVVEGLEEMILVVDRQYRYVIANRAFLKFRGLTPEEVVGRFVDELVGPDLFAQLVKQKMDECFLGKVVEYEMTCDFPNVGQRYLSASYFPIEGPTGIDRIACVLHDITEQRRSQEDLRKSEERFSKAFRNSPLAITISTEAEGRYLDVNRAFLQMLGYAREEVIGRTVEELGFWVYPLQRWDMIRQLRGIGGVEEFRTEYRTTKGEILAAVVSADLIELEGQACVLAITRDDTEIQRLETQFRQAQKMEAVGRLAGGVAHDFNNALGVIAGYATLLEERLGAEAPERKFTQQIRLAGERAASITRQLLAFSRRQVLQIVPLDLNSILSGMEDMLSRMMREDVKLTIDRDPALQIVDADRGRIEQVVMNLAVNARDAMPGGGELIIRTSNAVVGPSEIQKNPFLKAGRFVMLAVSDNGCGMDQVTRAQVFEPFFTTKEVGKGTGLGLSTVYGIIKQSKGYICVTSEPGRGTTFQLYFPISKGTPKPAAPEDPAPRPVGGTETILVVEDEEALRWLICDALRAAGYSVVEAADGQTAGEVGERHGKAIDLLLTDVVLPQMSGRRVSENLLMYHPAIKVLYMSGYTDDYISHHGVLTAGTTLIEKPFSIDSLFLKIREVLDRKPDEPSIQ